MQELVSKHPVHSSTLVAPMWSAMSEIDGYENGNAFLGEKIKGLSRNCIDREVLMHALQRTTTGEGGEPEIHRAGNDYGNSSTLNFTPGTPRPPTPLRPLLVSTRSHVERVPESERAAATLGCAPRPWTPR